MEIGGEEAASFAVHFKGETFHAVDHRGNWGMLLGCAISGGGPRWEAVPVGNPDYEKDGQAEAVAKAQIGKLFRDSTGVCSFGNPKPQTMLDAYEALTGIKLTIEDTVIIGERIANLQRAFNIKHGFKPDMDLDISPRMLEAQINGPGAGKHIGPVIGDMVKEYNSIMDWDWETGKPSKEKLEKLGLKEIAVELWGVEVVYVHF